MVGRLPLSALLSQAFVAFTIEFDNEFEHRVPHRTTEHGSTPGTPWLVSRAMWSHFMRFVDEEGTPLREFQQRVGMPAKSVRIWLTRMSRWWRYVQVDSLVTPTAGGRKAIAAWRTLDNMIESRWRSRFGDNAIDALRAPMTHIVGQIDRDLPECLPILGYGLVSECPEQGKPGAKEKANHATLSLVSLIAKVLVAFALEFERESEVSIAIGANVLRLIGEEGAQVRDLPRLAGVSKEATAMALSFLCKRGYAVIEASPGGRRGKVVQLNSNGRQARETYFKLVETIEERWRKRFGEDTVGDLRVGLEQLAGDPLLRGLQPYPDGWRASLPTPGTLPHYPMVLHRGGYPDGS